MSKKANHYDMEPVTGEKVKVDGVYENEAGREEELNRGETFPADLILGSTEWKLTQYSFDNHHDGETDPRLVPKKDSEKEIKITHPRRHLIRGDR
ncbi:transposase [Paenibacillus sp. GCM10012307]|uniref:Transposase n=1 Tax=Paenibacillus roseus TaxID=2798579 RepID=A0A934J2V4_9BACL|nr:transposase [Paenibacillus roseus]MBJ6360453.1 transposase [Paenibacillus roseus]